MGGTHQQHPFKRLGLSINRQVRCLITTRNSWMKSACIFCKKISCYFQPFRCRYVAINSTDWWSPQYRRQCGLNLAVCLSTGAYMVHLHQFTKVVSDTLTVSMKTAVDHRLHPVSQICRSITPMTNRLHGSIR